MSNPVSSSLVRSEANGIKKRAKAIVLNQGDSVMGKHSRLHQRLAPSWTWSRLSITERPSGCGDVQWLSSSFSPGWGSRTRKMSGNYRRLDEILSPSPKKLCQTLLFWQNNWYKWCFFFQATLGFADISLCKYCLKYQRPTRLALWRSWQCPVKDHAPVKSSHYVTLQWPTHV